MKATDCNLYNIIKWFRLRRWPPNWSHTSVPLIQKTPRRIILFCTSKMSSTFQQQMKEVKISIYGRTIAGSGSCPCFLMPWLQRETNDNLYCIQKWRTENLEIIGKVWKWNGQGHFISRTIIHIGLKKWTERWIWLIFNAKTQDGTCFITCADTQYMFYTLFNLFYLLYIL